jgi:histidine triad (HIT) family protein
VLVVPKRHIVHVMSADVEDWQAVAATARRMARWVVGAFRAGGVDLVQANSDGSVGNQTMFHLHVHVLPRYHDDQLGSWWSPQTADPAEITEAARRLIDFGRQDPETSPPLASTAP